LPSRLREYLQYARYSNSPSQNAPSAPNGRNPTNSGVSERGFCDVMRLDATSFDWFWQKLGKMTRAWSAPCAEERRELT
jgi:hypothetical protein